MKNSSMACGQWDALAPRPASHETAHRREHPGEIRKQTLSNDGS